MEKRSALGENGLIGKVQFNSAMSEAEVRVEVCKVFAKAMAMPMCESDELFPFEYLQRTGAGSRSLCRPAVSESFEWNGKQVSSLAKSGGYMYIAASQPLPGCVWVSIFVIPLRK